MERTLATLTFCLLLLVAAGFPSFDKKGGAPKEKRVQYAAWDDVNVIAHGLLQLGQGLKEHVDKAKVQMRDISAKLKLVNRTVADLGKESQRLRAEGEALKSRGRELEAREGQLLNLTAALREKAEEMQLERRAMSDRVSRLEQMLPDAEAAAAANSSDARHVQVMLENQNRRIDDLLERIRLQQEKLDKQNARIRTLQNQVLESRKDGGTDASAEQSDSPFETASDCQELFLRGEATSGLYTIQPEKAEPFKVFCEMTASGGWTVMQRRQDGSVDFDQPWEAYLKGFGSPNGESWLGLEKVHSIVKDGGYVLNIQLFDWNGDVAGVTLPFSLGGEDTQFSLQVRKDGPLSTLERSLGADALGGLPFSTRDRDNDRKNDTSCATHLSGGWWFGSCGHSNLNGRYFQSPPPKHRHQRKQGIFWKSWRGRYYPLKKSVMMIAPASIQSKS